MTCLTQLAVQATSWGSPFLALEEVSTCQIAPAAPRIQINSLSKKKYQRGFKSQGTKAKISGAVNPRESMLQRYQKRPLLNTGSGGCTHCLRHSFMGPNSIGISWNVTETSEPKNQKLEKYNFGDLRGNLQTCN